MQGQSETDTERVSARLDSLGVEARRVDLNRWMIELEAAGQPLAVELELRGELLRASAAVLPGDMIDPHQLLFWNHQAPLVCFAENRAGEVLLSGELVAAQLGAGTLDRFLGLLLASAARAREFVISHP